MIGSFKDDRSDLWTVWILDDQVADLRDATGIDLANDPVDQIVDALQGADVWVAVVRALLNRERELRELSPDQFDHRVLRNQKSATRALGAAAESIAHYMKAKQYAKR